MDIDDDGREGVERCTLGTGIMDRLGGRGGCMGLDPDALMPEVENAGEKERR